MSSFDYDARTVETLRPEPPAEAPEGPAGTAYAECGECDTTIVLVDPGHPAPATWYHINTRFRVCQGEATVATPRSGTTVRRVS